MSDSIDDDAPDFRPSRSASPPDLSGEAALLLVESLIHALVAKSGLSLPEAIEVVQIAIDAQLAIGKDRGDDPDQTLRSASLLAAIANSLGIDAHQDLAARSNGAEPHD
jgi:hypothetical protein